MIRFCETSVRRTRLIRSIAQLSLNAAVGFIAIFANRDLCDKSKIHPHLAMERAPGIWTCKRASRALLGSRLSRLKIIALVSFRSEV